MPHRLLYRGKLFVKFTKIRYNTNAIKFSKGRMLVDMAQNRFFTALYTSYYAQLLQRAYRCIGDLERAKDLVQEVFVTALVREEILLRHPCPAGWLHKTLSNLMKREKQRAIWQQRLLEDGCFAPKPVPGGSIIAILPTKLSEEEKTLLLWRFEEELSYAEIGNRLGIAPSAVGMRLLRAKQRCREMLEAEEKIFSCQVL